MTVDRDVYPLAGVGAARVAALGGRLIDADNHYYEPKDAFTRYLDPDVARQAFRWFKNQRGEDRLIVNGREFRAITNPSFDPIGRPGTLLNAIRTGRDPSYRVSGEALDPLVEKPEYWDREARLRVMDRQNVERIVLFPTTAVMLEQHIWADPVLHAQSLRAFNRWLDEDWGFNHADRIYAVPLLWLADLESAIEELKWVVSRGARMIHLRSSYVGGFPHGHSPADPRFDSFWSIVNDAGLVVAFHTGDHGYLEQSANWGEIPYPPSSRQTPLQRVTTQYRAAYDVTAALVLHGLFERFPRIRMYVAEQGADFARFLLRQLHHVRDWFDVSAMGADPVDVFREYVYVEPFPEEDLEGVVKELSADRVVFGSDFPHVEGAEDPADFFDPCGGISDADIRKIMRLNALSLLTEPV